MRRLLLATTLLLAGCSYQVNDPRGRLEADCHTYAFTSFCVVNVKDHDQRLIGSTSGVVPAISGVLAGSANTAVLDEGFTLIKH